MEQLLFTDYGTDELLYTYNQDASSKIKDQVSLFQRPGHLRRSGNLTLFS
jgi:hypothetical protein